MIFDCFMFSISLCNSQGNTGDSPINDICNQVRCDIQIWHCATNNDTLQEPTMNCMSASTLTSVKYTADTVTEKVSKQAHCDSTDTLSDGRMETLWPQLVSHRLYTFFKQCDVLFHFFRQLSLRSFRIGFDVFHNSGYALRLTCNSRNIMLYSPQLGFKTHETVS